MARTIRDTKLETRAARERLKVRHEPYWRAIDRGAHLGYRKGKLAGTWVTRWRPPNGGPYKKRALGKADDRLDDTDPSVLDYWAAQERAREWFAEQARKAGGTGVPYKVKDAIEDYLSDYATRGRALETMRYSIDAHILPQLGDMVVEELTPEQIKTWLNGLAATPPRLRSRRGAPARYRPMTDDPAEARRRKATANKVLTMLKAALNFAFEYGKVTDDKAWRRVKPFQKVDAPKIRYLNEEETLRLSNACDPDFRQLVQGALLTGCRYGELAQLKVSDVDANAGTIYVALAKSGESRHVVLNEEGQAFFGHLTAGRSGEEHVFVRADGRSWGKSHQTRRLKEACERTSIAPAISFHILRHTHGSWLAMKGVPMAVIAKQLGHKNDLMAQKHYAHLAPDYVKDTIRRNLPEIGISKVQSVIRLRNG